MGVGMGMGMGMGGAGGIAGCVARSGPSIG